MKLRPIHVVIVLILAVSSYMIIERMFYAKRIIAAQKLEESKDYLGAIEIYKIELRHNPGNFEVYKLLGNTYLKIRENKKAMEILKKAVKIKPNDYSTLESLGILYFSEKDLKSAEDCFKKAIALKPGSASAHFCLARLYHEKKKYNDAEFEYNKALKTGFEKRRIYYNLACLYEYSTNDYDKTLELYQKYLSTGGAKSANTLKRMDRLNILNQAVSFEEVGQYNKAVTEYEKLLAKDPKSDDSISRLARAYLLAKRYEDAERMYLKILDKRKNDYNTLVSLGIIYTELDSPGIAEDYIRKAITVKPDSPRAHCALGILCIRYNRPIEAESEFNIAVKYGQKDYELYYNMGLLNEDKGNNEKALGYYKKCLDLNTSKRAEISKKIDKLSNSRQDK